jgi:hypothetical protein
VPAGHSHRTIGVGQDHELLQQRRRDQQTASNSENALHRRNAIDGAVRELAHAHGLQRSRYRGFAKVEL